MRLRGQLHIPGNLLIAGEYAVLTEGGLGVSMAVGPPVLARVADCNEFRLVARMGAYTTHWSPDASLEGPSNHRVGVFEHTLKILTDESCVRDAFSPGEQKLAERIVEVCRRVRERSFDPVEISVDTRSLFTRDGRKLGYGSSAAATVASVAGLLAAAGYDPVSDRRVVQRLATAAHRSLQGTVGSGYDIATSVFGGMGLFTGGVYPRYQRVLLPWFPQPAIEQGEKPQSTKGAVDLFKSFQEQEPDRARDLLERNQRLVRKLLDTITSEDGFGVLHEIRRLGEELGELVGVPADVETAPPDPASDTGCSRRFRKALGAGNETILVLPHVAGCPGRAIIRDDEGLRWA